MLHGVRFLQSQLHARVAEFSLKDWLAAFKEQEFKEPNIASQARRAHREAKIHCFLNGFAVAVEGELKTQGLVLVASDNAEFALRVLCSITPLWIPTEYPRDLGHDRLTAHRSNDAERSLQSAATALTEGVLVAWPTRVVARAHTEELIRTAVRLDSPVVGATVEESSSAHSSDPLDALLARRDVLVTIGTPLTTVEAQSFVGSECTKPTSDVRARAKGRSLGWKPADAALS